MPWSDIGSRINAGKELDSEICYIRSAITLQIGEVLSNPDSLVVTQPEENIKTVKVLCCLITDTSNRILTTAPSRGGDLNLTLADGKDNNYYLPSTILWPQRLTADIAWKL